MKGKFISFLLNLTLIAILFCSNSYSQTPFSGLVLEQVNNEEAVPGITYRLYAELSEGKLYAIYADESNPSLLETTSSFFNEVTFGGDFQSDVNPALYATYPNVQWDTWVTIGNSFDDAVQIIGDLNINLFGSSSWSFGGTVNSDASIFRTPDNPHCLPDANGRVLIGQFTTDGDLSGYLNLRMKNDAGDVFEELATIPSDPTIGCMDSSASNFCGTCTIDNSD